MCFLLKFYFSLQTNFHPVDDIINDDYMGLGKEYIEMVYFANCYIEQYQMYSLIILANLFNVLAALRIFRIVHWIMLIIEKTFAVIGLFMLILFPIQFGFSYLSLVFIGPYLQDYSSITKGLKMQIITMMGQ